MANTTSVGEVRAWAKQQGFDIADRGRLPADVWEAWNTSQKTAPTKQQPRNKQAPVPAATAQELEEARTRITQVEDQLAELVDRVASLESRPTEPRRRLSRSR